MHSTTSTTTTVTATTQTNNNITKVINSSAPSKLPNVQNRIPCLPLISSLPIDIPSNAKSPLPSTRRKSSNNQTAESVDIYTNDKLKINKENIHRKRLSHRRHTTENHDDQKQAKLKTGNLLLGKDCIKQNNEFFAKLDDTSANTEHLIPTKIFKNNLCHHIKLASNEKKFDEKVLNSLKINLTSKSTQTISLIENRIYNFCNESLIEHFSFYKNANPFEEYYEYEFDRISLFLAVIQRSVLLQDLLPRFFYLKQDLMTYLSNSLKKSKFTSILYLLLQNLIKFDTYSAGNCDIIYGKNISKFIKEIKEILGSNNDNSEANLLTILQEIFDIDKDKSESEFLDEIKEITGHVFSAKELKGYVSNNFQEIFIQVLEGIEKENKDKINDKTDLSLLSFLEKWSSLGNGGLSKEFKIIHNYCNEIAPLCFKVLNLPSIEYHCHINHFHSETDKTESTTTSLSPKSNDHNPFNNSANNQKLSPKSEEKLNSTSGTDELIPHLKSSKSEESFRVNEKLQIKPSSPKKIEKQTRKNDRLKSSFNEIFQSKSKTTDKSMNHFPKSSTSTNSISQPFSLLQAEQNAKKIYTNKGLRLNKHSYSIDPIHELFRSLISFEEIIPNKISVNSQIFHIDENSKSSNDSTNNLEKYVWINKNEDPTFNFFYNLFNCFHLAGLENVTEKQLLEEVELLMKYNDSSIQNIELNMPCLNVAELMTILCRGVAHFYFMYLFPDLFPKLYNLESPYFVRYPQGVEVEIKIQNKKKFSVKQRNQLTICLTENFNKIVATIDYTWTNQPGENYDQVKNWNGVLKFKSKVHDPAYWKPIMTILANPSDLSSRVDLPEALHFHKINRQSKK